jgi:hypothetical protein
MLNTAWTVRVAPRPSRPSPDESSSPGSPCAESRQPVVNGFEVTDHADLPVFFEAYEARALETALD